MAAAKLDITIEQGATWSKTLSLLKPNKTPVSLVGYTGKAQVRTKPGSEDVLAEFTITFLDPRTGGKLSYSLTDEQTEALTFATASYDLFIVSPSGTSTKLVYGTVSVVPAITQLDESE